jgi:hypothetical protein
MSRNVIKGGDMMLFINQGTTTKSIAFATCHTLTVSTDTQQTSTKDDGGKFQSSDYGIISWSASSENLCSYDGAGYNYQDLIDLMLSQTKVTAIFSVEGSSGSTYPYANKLDSVDDATGACTITPPDGSKAPDFKPVDAKRLGKPPFVDQAFPDPTFCKPQLWGTIQ